MELLTCVLSERVRRRGIGGIVQSAVLLRDEKPGGLYYFGQKLVRSTRHEAESVTIPSNDHVHRSPNTILDAGMLSNVN